MIPILQRLETTGTWTSQRQELGNYLGLDGPVADAVLLRARADDQFASLLVLGRSHRDLLDLLFEAPRTRAFAAAPEPPQAAARTTAQTLRKAAGSLLQWVRSGFENVDDATYEARLETCRGCPNLVEPPDLVLYKLQFDREKDMRVCNLCGCVARRKARLATERCPDNRWPATAGTGGVS